MLQEALVPSCMPPSSRIEGVHYSCYLDIYQAAGKLDQKIDGLALSNDHPPHLNALRGGALSLKGDSRVEALGLGDVANQHVAALGTRYTAGVF